MAKTKELYYKKADAIKAAEDFQKLFGGYMMQTSADDRTSFNFEDDIMQNMCWSGELAAVEVYGAREGMAGLFAWWEE